jgi:alternate F1F0 ATPase F1 subunit epsilon
MRAARKPPHPSTQRRRHEAAHYHALSVVVDEDGVLALRAEDATGGLGVLPRHADFLTSLTISVVGWKSADAKRRFCAVRHGVLSVTEGRTISVATREAILGDDLATLDQTVPRPLPRRYRDGTDQSA